MSDHLVCGCPTNDHMAGCQLGAAETIAVEAAGIGHRAAPAGNWLVQAISALAEAGILLDLPTDHCAVDVLFGVLDTLWEADLIAPAIEQAEAASPVSDRPVRVSGLHPTDRPQSTIEQAEAASGVSDRG